MTNWTFAQNSTDSTGGGIEVSYQNNGEVVGNVSLMDCTLTENTAASEGEGIHIEEGAVTSLETTTVCNNSPDQLFGQWSDNGGNTVTTTCGTDCADITGDGVVDVVDLLKLLGTGKSVGKHYCKEMPAIIAS